jgi:hypothetical protein
MDKKAWKVLKKLYPDSVQLEAGVGGCLMCTAECEAAKKAEADKKEEAKTERKRPLSCPLVRGFYSRGNKGYPVASCDPLKVATYTSNAKTEDDSLFSLVQFVAGTHQCPLKPGVYWTLPRSWCKNWRKYLKTGEGALPPAPDGSEMLCDAHNLPLVPPHLESFLSGETSTLYGSPNNSATGSEEVARMPTAAASLRSSAVSDAETLQVLRAAGLSELEVHTQRVAMMELEEERQRAAYAALTHQLLSGAEVDRAATNEQLDRENRVVVEILTDEEVSALEKWWPHVNIMYGIRFAVIETESDGNTRREVLWHTLPCRECDPSSRADAKFVVRNRLAQRGFH